MIQKFVSDHIKEQIGEIASLTEYNSSEGDTVNFLVAKIPEAPIVDAITYATVGLSEHLFTNDEGDLFRCELIVTTYENFPPSDLEEMICRVGEELITSSTAPLIGRVMDYKQPLIPGASTEAVLFCLPYYHSADLSILEYKDLTIFFYWMLPIIRSEVQIIASEGYEGIDSYFEKEEPDLMNLQR